MSHAKMMAARELIQERRYAEARQLLVGIDHPTARQWLARIDEIAPEAAGKAAPPTMQPPMSPRRATPGPDSTVTSKAVPAATGHSPDRRSRWQRIRLKLLIALTAVLVMVLAGFSLYEQERGKSAQVLFYCMEVTAGTGRQIDCGAFADRTMQSRRTTVEACLARAGGLRSALHSCLSDEGIQPF